MQEGGLFVTWQKRHWPVDQCAIERQENRTSSRVLGLKDIRAAFSILAVGLGLAVVAFMMEFAAVQILLRAPHTKDDGSFLQNIRGRFIQ